VAIYEKARKKQKRRNVSELLRAFRRFVAYCKKNERAIYHAAGKDMSKTSGTIASVC
jgi:hypothetical protein